MLFGSGDANSYPYVLNNPLKYTDRKGLFVDTLLDVTFIGYDIYSLVTGGRKDFKNNLTALGLDIVGAVLPGVTGLGIVVRSEKEVAVIAKGLGNIGGGATTAESALVHGEKWLGPGYREIAPGVFRSADDTKQFRMTSHDLTDPIQGPHVHFESIGSNGRTVVESSHVTIINP